MREAWSESLWGESSIPAALREQAARDRARAAADRERAAHDRSRRRATASSLRAIRSPGRGPEARGWPTCSVRSTAPAARRGSLVLAFVDVDGLKQVNETQGHLAGDRLLAEVASALRGGLRSYDLLMRFGWR